ncbi:MAG TPA: hypothetical protein VFG04_15910 [Planctomycetaceae bacterium]|jgi:hypothetical protein|nr:hypothetical protein [Planctomycetaceae bacterium]
MNSRFANQPGLGESSMIDWPFVDPENTATITVRKIMSGETWISFVSHDADDGCWQFMPPEPPQQEEAIVVALREIVTHDSSLRELGDLPLGWCAWRNSPNDAWQRAPASA